MGSPKDWIRVHYSCASLVESALRDGLAEITRPQDGLLLLRNKDLKPFINVRPISHNHFIVTNRGLGLEMVRESSTHKIYKPNGRRLLGL